MFRSCLTFTVMGAALVFVGCAEEPAGGPGADTRVDTDTDPQNEEATFAASLGDESLSIAAGSEQEFDVGIARGEDFDQTVIAHFEAPEHITVTPSEIEYAPGQETGTVVVQAAANAAVGEEVSVAIHFQPESGQDIVKQLTVMVTEPESDDEESDETEDQIEIDDQE